MRLAVLADVHGLAETYEAALQAARAEGFDRLVILGDLLTYGVEPQRTLDLTSQCLVRDDAVLLLGNHDQLYLDQTVGEQAYADNLPDWIRESVAWTRREIDGAMPLAAFEWQTELEIGPLLIAHANPYGAGDWRYLSSDDRMRDACEALADRGLSLGVFGHTHRFRRFTNGAVSVVTVGSLGQPRDRDDRLPHWAMVSLEGASLEVHRRNVPFDRDAHVKAIRSTSLSPATMDRLCEFFS